MMGSGTTQKVLAIHQSEEVSILSEQNLVLQLCDVLKKHSHGGQTNQGY